MTRVFGEVERAFVWGCLRMLCLPRTAHTSLNPRKGGKVEVLSDIHSPWCARDSL